MTRQQLIDAVKVKLEEISPFDEPESFIADGDDAANTDKPIISYIDKSLDEAAHNCLNSLPLTLLHADMVREGIGFQIDHNGVGLIYPYSSQNRLVRFRQKALKRAITSFITTEDPLYLLQQNNWTRGGIAKPVMVLASNSGGEGIVVSQPDQCQLEIYSFPESMYGSVLSDDADKGILLYVPTNLHAGRATIIYDGVVYSYSGVSSEIYWAWGSQDNTFIFTAIGHASVGDNVYSAPSSVALLGQISSAVGDPAVKSYKSPIDEYVVLECAAMVASILGDTATTQICQAQYQAKLQSILQ